MANDDQQTAPYFYGLQPYNFSRDRLYRVYVSEKMLVGAYVAGQIYDEHSAAIHFQHASLFFRPLVRYWLTKRLERETLYDSLDPFGSSFMEQDPRNFRILRSEVARTRFRRNRSRWTRFNVGVVEIELLVGVKRRFILVGDQPPDAIMQLMLEFDPELEITGKPNPLPLPKPISPAAQRRSFVVLGFFLIALSVLIGYLALTRVPPRPTDWPLVVFNLMAAIWTFVMAWRVSGTQPEADSSAGPDRSAAKDSGEIEH